MSDDGSIDYSNYSDAELKDVLRHIDPTNHPENYRNLLAAIESRKGDFAPALAANSSKRKFSIPTGTHGFIEIPLDKKYIAPFRIIMLLMTVPFAIEVYDVVSTGIVDRGSYVDTRGEDFGYYAYLAKYLSLALLFLWLGSFGVKDKEAVAGRSES